MEPGRDWTRGGGQTFRFWCETGQILRMVMLGPWSLLGVVVVVVVIVVLSGRPS